MKTEPEAIVNHDLNGSNVIQAISEIRRAYTSKLEEVCHLSLYIFLLELLVSLGELFNQYKLLFCLSVREAQAGFVG